ncbi:MAG: radical SAM protein, partial [Elusimicrobia bacterium]|nr:radical SAM protein [Elusimicrobiota bacterium]
MGSACNNNCRYCSWRSAKRSASLPAFAEAGPTGTPGGKRVRTYGELLNELRTFRTDMPLLLAGGEPAIRKGFFSFLAHLRGAMGFREVGLVTNGRIFSRAGLARYAVKCGVKYFFVKLPAFRNSTYAALCGSAGGLEEAVAGLENIAQASSGGLRIIIPVVPENIRELPDIAGAISPLRPERVLFDLSHAVLTPPLKRSLAGVADALRQDGIDTGADLAELLRLQPGGGPARGEKTIRPPKMNLKISSSGGGYFQTGSDPRSVSPAQTIRTAEKVIGKTTFSRIKPLCEGTNGVYIYEFGKSRPESPRSLPAQFGKGFDREQALASGYMETIERFSGVITAAEKRKIVYAPYADIRKSAVDPALFHITQPA